ncbi:hypothetical protein [Butyrivibrio sp. VCD2006]|uniref:hypothetical protein n=1 Tax=Butyrivibrio sp. VCD2006 TaxID=1280664 RepID=UPI00041B601A|nr:hypothetical protein [Butyrivibrio sp. VCD2006]
MDKYSKGSRMIAYLCICVAICALILCPFCGFSSRAWEQGYYTGKVILTAPSAEKLFDGTPLTEQIDVTAQGLPPGYTYKAVAEGSVTYPEDNEENNNVVTDYIIYDPSGLNVTDRFVNVELRPGTLRISDKEAVLGAKRNEDGSEVINEDKTKNDVSDEKDVIEIEEEDTAKSDKPNMIDRNYFLDIVMYTILVVIMLAVFVIFLMDSHNMREK